MKSLVNFLKDQPVREGWTGAEGDKAYDQIHELFASMDGGEICDIIWSYFDCDTLADLYKWLKEDEYIVDDDDLDECKGKCCGKKKCKDGECDKPKKEEDKPAEE